MLIAASVSTMTGTPAQRSKEQSIQICGANSLLRLEPCSLADIGPFIIEHHRSHNIPGSARAKHCYCIKSNELLAAMICGPTEQPGVVEFISQVMLPGFNYPQSRLVSLTVGYLKALRHYEVALSWNDPRWGDGMIFRGASWHYSGRGKPTPEGWRSEATGFHLYWRPLIRKYQNSLGLLKLDYP